MLPDNSPFRLICHRLIGRLQKPVLHPPAFNRIFKPRRYVRYVELFRVPYWVYQPRSNRGAAIFLPLFSREKNSIDSIFLHHFLENLYLSTVSFEIKMFTIITLNFELGLGRCSRWWSNLGSKKRILVIGKRNINKYYSCCLLNLICLPNL